MYFSFLNGIRIMKNIQIIEKSSGHKIAEYPFLLEFYEDQSEQDFIDDAWELAMEEGLVDESCRENYDLEIIGDITPDQQSEFL